MRLRHVSLPGDAGICKRYSPPRHPDGASAKKTTGLASVAGTPTMSAESWTTTTTRRPASSAWMESSSREDLASASPKFGRDASRRRENGEDDDGGDPGGGGGGGRASKVAPLRGSRLISVAD